MKLLEILDRDLSAEESAVTMLTPDIGLSTEQAAQRLAEDGKNELAHKKPRSAAVVFFSQYKDIMTIILIVCTVISVVMGELTEAAAIAVIILMNGVLGFVQEYRSEKALDALKSMASPAARAYRGGVLTRISASELVRSDVIELTSGDRIPADCEYLSGAEVLCDEAMLTGESQSVEKEIGNPLFMGCSIKSGHCRARVTQTGKRTEMGKISSMLTEIKEEPTPLQRKLTQLSKYIAVGCLVICAAVTLTGIMRGEDFLQMLITGVSLAVAAVPEGLPAIVTISLALSVSRMIKRKALVRRLHAVETLGCATVICSDKTGTITQNKMSVAEVCTSSYSGAADKINVSDKTAEALLRCVSLCNNAQIPDAGEPSGGATETALLAFAKKHGFSPELLGSSRLSETPFDSARKRMSVIVKNENGEKFLFVKGALDLVLSRSISYDKSGAEAELTPSVRAGFIRASDEMANRALRVIGAAYKRITPVSPSAAEDNLTFLGLIGIIDPPRPEVKRAVARCRKAGIRTVMITGDRKATAVAIARATGIYRDGDKAYTGAELDEMNDNALKSAVEKASVFAAVSPENKLQIVRALKSRGNVTAMTGDGVNDAPAIKEADVGVSMGIMGSDVTQEASDVILLDDNFATLANALEDGRGIYENIRKFIRYLLSCNIGEVLTMFVGMLMGMPVILLPIQILLVNLVTDGLPAIALGLEPTDSEVMSRPPRKPNEGVFSHGLGGKIIFRGILIGFTTLMSFSMIFSTSGDLAAARSGGLFALVLAQLIHVFECKSETHSIRRIHPFNNKALVAAALISLIIVLAVLYFPPLAAVFSAVPLTLPQILIPIGLCASVPIIWTLFSRN